MNVKVTPVQILFSPHSDDVTAKSLINVPQPPPEFRLNPVYRKVRAASCALTRTDSPEPSLTFGRHPRSAPPSENHGSWIQEMKGRAVEGAGARSLKLPRAAEPEAGGTRITDYSNQTESAARFQVTCAHDQ